MQEKDLDKQIKLYPNPSNGLLYLELAEAIAIESIVVYDYLGRTTQFTSTQENTNLKINDLSSGVYQILITTKDQDILLKKVVIY
jgi:hypothetical protein